MALENDKQSEVDVWSPMVYTVWTIGNIFNGIIKMLQRSEWQICDNTESRKLTVKKSLNLT